MNKIIYSLVYNRKKSLNKRGVALVQVEAYLNRKKKLKSIWDRINGMRKNY